MSKGRGRSSLPSSQPANQPTSLPASLPAEQPGSGDTYMHQPNLINNVVRTSARIAINVCIACVYFHIYKYIYIHIHIYVYIWLIAVEQTLIVMFGLRLKHTPF
jgi:hypothetical protein